MPYINSDGLLVKFGVEGGQTSRGGEINVEGADHITEIAIKGTDIPSLANVVAATSTNTTLPLMHGVELPLGARIQKIEIQVETAFTSGGSATLDFGLVREDRTTELDYNGLIAAQTVASLSAGAFITLTTGSGTAGALMGTVLANRGVFTVNYNTAAFTAGKAVIRVYWNFPNNNV